MHLFYFKKNHTCKQTSYEQQRMRKDIRNVTHSYTLQNIMPPKSQSENNIRLGADSKLSLQISVRVKAFSFILLAPGINIQVVRAKPFGGLRVLVLVGSVREDIFSCVVLGKQNPHCQLRKILKLFSPRFILILVPKILNPIQTTLSKYQAW